MDIALRMLIRLRKQGEVVALEGRIAWEGDHGQMRRPRHIAEPDEDSRADSGRCSRLIHRHLLHRQPFISVAQSPGLPILYSVGAGRSLDALLEG